MPYAPGTLATVNQQLGLTLATNVCSRTDNKIGGETCTTPAEDVQITRQILDGSYRGGLGIATGATKPDAQGNTRWDWNKVPERFLERIRQAGTLTIPSTHKNACQ